ncbi:MAG TPA: MFS transporter [Nitrococcus sp.]|nr:MFS transporter [Nitrococcus sp.]
MISFGKGPCDEGAIRAAIDTGGCTERAKPWVLAATILGSSMAFIDGSVVNIALPVIQADLAASVTRMQWVVNAYLLLLGALVLIGGAAGDRFGRRRIFALGIVLFTAASIACGLATGATGLITARAVQGAGGALLVPSSLAIISAAFGERERGRAIGTWAAFSALTTSLGPVLGGWVINALSWRVIFFINVPIALVALALVLWRVPESRNTSGSAAVDWRGGFLATLGLGAIAYGLTGAADSAWIQPAVLGPLVGGVFLLVVFLWVESRATSPMMPLGLFRSRAFSGANGMTLLLYFALGGALFFLPFNLIGLQGYSATAAGASFLPFTLALGGLSRWSGALQDRYGAKRLLTIGPIIAAAGFALLALPGIGGSYWRTFFPAMAVLGLGMGISVAPLTTTVMAAVEQRHAGAASGINNAVARLAGMLAVALLGAIAVGVFGQALEARLRALSVAPEIQAALREQIPKLAEARVPPGIEGAARQSVARALDMAFLASFRTVMLIAAGMALVSALCAGLTLRAAAAPARTSP